MDQIATHDYGIPAMVLMERAGLAVYEAVKQLLPESGRVVVLCGKGNNGGDGLVVARLAYEGNYHVEVLVAATESQLSEECRTQLAVCRAQGVQPIFCDDARWGRKLECLGAFDVVIDALLGTGAKGEVQGAVLDSIRAINRSGVPSVSVDVPSGIHADTGEDLGESVWALRTVTFGLPKPFLFQGIGMEHAGYWSVADIGYPSALLQTVTEARLIEEDWVSDLVPERLRTAHKRDNGHVLVVAGSDLMPGAAVLACRAALRAGTGLVTLASTESVCRAVSTQLPEVMLLVLPSQDGFLAAEAADVIKENVGRADSAIFGPGMGQADSVREFLVKVWRNWDLPSCIDADALNAVAHGVPLPECECVLTPHPGEMSRLLNSSIAEIQSDRFKTVETATVKFGKTVILKGPHTIVGDRDQPLSVNVTGNPGMATAGMGDVLSGVIGALLSQDLPPYCAATVAAYWHGLAADACAESIGPIGYLASDVADMLPKARAKLTASCEARSRVRSLPLSCSF